MMLKKAISTTIFALGVTLAGAIVTPAMAQDQELGKASDVVRLLFAKHTARFKANDVPLMNEAGMISRFFVDCLAVDGLQGKLGFDPVYGAQDAEIAGLKVYPDPDMPMFRGAAQIRLDFTNFGTQRSFVYTLIKAANGEWQISDIYSDDDGWSLTELMRDAGIPNVACDPANEITLFDPPAGGQAGANESGMEEGDLPAHMNEESAMAEAGAADPDAEIGMEQGDAPAYTNDGTGSDLLFILDGSGSMWGQIDGTAKISTAKQALSGLLSDLSGQTNVGLMAYGHRREGDCGDIETLLPVANHAPEAVGLAINGITPRGKTPIARTLEAAAGVFPAADRQANILLISDGLETCGGDPCAAAQALASQGIKTRVHVVGFDLTDEENRALQCIADEGNGNYYTANNAEEFVEAVNEAVAATKEVEQPAPPPQQEAYFVETFEGPEISEAWSFINENRKLKALDSKGAMFVAVAGEHNHYDKQDAINRFVLDKALPDGDFDLVLDARLVLQTGREHIWLSLMEDANNQIGAALWTDWKGCGPAIHLSLIKLAGAEGSKPEKTAFDTSLFGGPMVDDICGKGRPYADAIFRALHEEGAVVSLRRRGRQITAALEMALPAFEDREVRNFSIESEPITALRLSGKPSIFVGQWNKGAPGESHFYLDSFAIESIGQ
jgi:Mg-chelatase subunit ChlD